MNCDYKVLNPWAEVEAAGLRGISSRLSGLENKRVGLFFNNKRAARPIQDVVEKRLQERFPELEFTRFMRSPNVSAGETEDAGKFKDWVRGVDAVIAAVGD